MFLRRLIIIIVAIVVLAAGVQFLRSFGVLNLIQNLNIPMKVSEVKKLDIYEYADPGSAGFEKYLVISNKEETNSAMVSGQLKKTLDYMKKDYDIIEYNGVEDQKSQYDSIFITFERLDLLENVEEYFDYANNGGSLVFLVRPVADKTFEKISSNLGIKSFLNKLYDNTGVRIHDDTLIAAEGFVSDTGAISNSAIKLSLDDSAQIHISAFDKNPLLWSKNYGSGKLIFFNGTALNEKSNRGLIASIISLAKPDLIYPVINVKMLHIDDFPAPVPEGTDKQIYEEFSRDIPKFYREVWWADMIKLAKKYDLKYSGFVIETYNDDTKPPFKGAENSMKKNLLLYGRDLMSIGGEIGLHGYNHQSLAPAGYIKQELGYKDWQSTDDMAESVKELINFINSVFANYELRSYVPPSNILSPDGREAVKQANPHLLVIASVYYDNLEGDVYSQEFEIADDGIIEFPRITSGYLKSDEIMWSIYNGINLYGVFSHFIHPDDVLDIERSSGIGWTEMMEEFDALIGEVMNKYKWLRKFTISSAAYELQKYIECKPYVEYTGNLINIYTDNYRKDIYCIFRTEKQIKSAQNCDYKKISDTAYLLELKDNVCSLKVE
jgi:hypothetical protein